MKLEDVEDLWDNKIMLRPGVKDTQIFSPGAATDSLYNIRWYQPHADDDRPDGANFKWLAWEMAGYKGYFDGYMAYYSQSYIDKKTTKNGTKTTDLIALKYITGKTSFKQYKLDRYKEAESHWKDTDTYINVQEILNAYIEALKKDANDPKRQLSNSTAVKRKYFVQIKQETNDFIIDPFTKKPNAQKTSVETKNLVEVDTKTKQTLKDKKDVVKNKNNDTLAENTVKNEVTNTTANSTTNSTSTTNTTSNNTANNTTVSNTVTENTTTNELPTGNVTENAIAKPSESKKENTVTTNTTSTK